MEEKKVGKLQKEKTHACICTMNLVKGTESYMEFNKRLLMIKLNKQKGKELYQP